MDYDELKTAFMTALRESGLPIIGLAPEETLALRSGDRVLTVAVESLDREIAMPFHVAASLSFRWDALQTARTVTCEDDLLVELLGRDDARDIETEQPWLRIDIELRAGLEPGKGIAMPPQATWARWAREALGRLERIEPLVSDEVVREIPGGRHAVLAWQGDPEVKATCNARGELRLEAITVSAFQGIDLPRKWNDSGREPDEHPHRQLRRMFERLKAALHAWGEVIDLLR